LLVGSAFSLLGVANSLDAWTLGMVAGLVVRVSFLLLAVALLLLGVSFLLDRWTLVGIAFLLLGVAAVLGGAAAWLDGWTLVGVPFLLFGVAALAGIGFMVSLLIGELAYGVADRRAEYVRIGVLASSL